MKNLKDFFKIMMGNDTKNKKVVEKRGKEAVDIKSEIIKDIEKINKKVDKINMNTYHALKEVNFDLTSVTYKIAVASGAKKRGLR